MFLEYVLPLSLNQNRFWVQIFNLKPFELKGKNFMPQNLEVSRSCELICSLELISNLMKIQIKTPRKAFRVWIAIVLLS